MNCKKIGIMNYVTNTDLSEKEIQKKSDEYWDCLMGNPSDCISL